MNKEDAMKADKEDGTLFNEHRLRVQHCGNEDKVDESKAIFVGNLSFGKFIDEFLIEDVNHSFCRRGRRRIVETVRILWTDIKCANCTRQANYDGKRIRLREL